MGLFHDKCTALVYADTEPVRTLAGADLAEAKAQGGSEGVLRDGRRWKICGHAVPKKARVCSKCGTGAPGGWVKCPSCGQWIGNDSHFCPLCNHPMHPEGRIDFAGGVWDHAPGLFAQRFDVWQSEAVLKSGIHVQQGTVAILLDGGKVSSVLGPGRHDIDGTLRKINWFGNPPPRSAVMADSGDIVLKLDFDGLRTAEERPVRMVADLTVRLIPSHAGDFISNLMKDSWSFPYDALRATFEGECRYAAANLCVKSTIEDLVKDPQRREAVEDELSRALRDLLGRTGFALVRVGAVDFVSAEYEELRDKYGDLDAERRRFEFDQKLMELAASKETAQIADEHAGIERSNEDAEFRAKKERELDEYIEQLAQEKGLSEVERSAEMAIFKLVVSGKLSASEAELKLAELQQDHAQKMAEIGNKLEIDLTLSNYAREEQLRQAEQKAKLAEFERFNRLEDAENEVEVYSTKVVGVAMADAAAEVHKTRMTREQQEARKIVVDTDIYEAEKWEDVRRRKQDIEQERLEGERAIERDREDAKIREADAEVARKRDLSIEAQIAMADNPEKIKALLEVERVRAQKTMTSDQLLGMAAATSPEAAKALAAMAAAAELTDRERNLYEARVKETREDRDKVLNQDGNIVKTVAGIAQSAVHHGEKATVVGAFGAGTGVGYPSTTTTTVTTTPPNASPGGTTPSGDA
jgi:hypothetical protein